MKLSEANRTAIARLNATEAAISPEILGLVFSDFELAAEEVVAISHARGECGLSTLQDPGESAKAMQEGLSPGEFVSSVLIGTWIEGLLTGLVRSRPGALDVGIEAQRAAERHLEACYEAQDEQDVQSPACAPFCGCVTCTVREVLFAAWPVFERYEAARP